MQQSMFRPKREGPGLMRVMFVLLILIAIAGAGVYGYFAYTDVTLENRNIEFAVLLSQAEEAIQNGDAGAGDALVRTIPRDQLDESNDARYAILMAHISAANDKYDDALTWLDQAEQRVSASTSTPPLRVLRGKCLEFSGDTSGATAIYDEIVETTPADVRAPALTGLGRIAEAKGNLEEARTLYERAVDDAPWDSDAWREAVALLGDINVELIFSVAETGDSTYYTVESGDNLTEIGKKLNTTQGLLIRANNLDDAGSLRIGDRLKYTHKDFRIVIERETRRLFLFDANGIFKVYDVGLGREGKETALGVYRIGNKQKDPDWFKPGEGRIPFGDPDNELGTRWMPLVPEQEDLPRDLGIHGTWDDNSVGEFASSGCARLTNALVEELYDLVVRATPVEIVDRIEPEPSNE